MQEYEEMLAKVRYFFSSLHYGIISWNNKGTSFEHTVRELRPEPLKIEVWQVVLDKKKLGPKFRRDAKAVENALSQNDLETLAALEKEEEITLSAAGLSEGKSEIKLGKDLISIGRYVRVEYTRDYTLNVIEPSFKSNLKLFYWRPNLPYY